MKKLSYNAFKKSFIDLLRYEFNQFVFKWEEVSGINETPTAQYLYLIVDDADKYLIATHDLLTGDYSINTNGEDFQKLLDDFSDLKEILFEKSSQLGL